ncbi:hypothetical protein ACLB2K_068667 [Fragaria x ananassa]
MGMQNILPFYSQNGSINGIQRGLNFGSAHATIMNHLSEDRALSFIKASIFYLSFGKDDFIELLQQNASGTAKQNSTDQEFAHILADQMIHVIRNLYAMNVKRIICMGILPLGCTPRVLLNQYNSTAQPHDDDDDVARGCVEETNAHVLEYNRELREQISELLVELSDAQLLFCDVYQDF